MRTALSLAVLTLGASVSWAQQFGVPNTMNSFLPIGAATGTAFGLGTALDADGDSLVDIAFVHGTYFECVFAPGVFMSFYDDIGYANDVACLPGGASSGADAVLSVSSGGLKSRELVRDSNNVASWPATTLEDDWGGAKRLDCRVLGGETWIFGLQLNTPPPPQPPTTKEVRALVDLGSGWTEGTLFTTTFNVTEIGALDYQGDGYLDLAVIGGSRWEIWSRNGSTFNWTRVASGLQSGFTLIDLAVGRQSGNNNEWVAFLASKNETPDRSAVIVRDSAGTQAPEEIAGQPDAIAVEAGDLDGDGNDDLVLSIRADAAMLVAVNQSSGSSPAFDGTRFAEPPLTPPTLTFEIPFVADDFEQNMAHPIVADFDNDFDLDFCLPLEPEGYTSGMLYVQRDPLPGTDPQPALVLAPNVCEGITVQDEGLGCSTSCLPLGVTANSNDPAFDRVEAFLWWKDPQNDHTTPGSICWDMKPHTSPAPVTYPLDLELASNPGFLGAENTGPRDEALYYFMICYVETNSNNVPIRILRPQVYGFQSECDYGTTCTNQGLLAGFASGAEGAVNSFDCDQSSLNCIDGPGIWTGSWVPVPCIPQLPNNDPPQLVRAQCSSCDLME